MRTIFFDLETSDLNTVGQILNYAFVEIDDDWNVISSLRDNVKISSLQLPTPEAIKANKIDVIEHQKISSDSEFVASKKIVSYLENIIDFNKTRLIGYNSANFDVHYLRTTLIRNGLNPYFSGNILYGDVLHAVKKLCLTNESFLSKMNLRENDKPNMSLESVCKALGLMSERDVQQHESMSDVLLTIKLAKHLCDEYQIDVRERESYEVNKRATDFDAIKIHPYTDKDGKKVSDEYCYMTLLEQNRGSSLWINLKQYEDGLDKKSVQWYNKNSSSFIVKEYVRDDSIRARCDEARKNLSHINIQNYWPEKACDVEQFIYMLPINEIRTLENAIHNKDLFLLKQNKNKYANILYLRFLCANIQSDEISKIADKYLLHRYGGKMRLDKNVIDSSEVEYHATYNELLSRIDDSDSLMNSLKLFYQESRVAKLLAT